MLCALPSIGGPVRAQVADNPADVDELQQLLSIFADGETFRQAIAASVELSPLLKARRANNLEAEGAKREAESAKRPTIDLSISASRALAREFSNDPDNVIERSRGNGRADVTASANQMLFDFGAANRRIEAATARIEAARADTDAAYENGALRSIGAWIDVAAYAQLVSLAENQLAKQTSYRKILQARVDQGVSAPADHARLDAAIATSEQRASRFRQELGNAQARFRDFFGADVAQPVRRPPLVDWQDADVQTIVDASQNAAAVRSAKARAEGAREDARAARAETLPNVSAGLDAGRYGILEAGRNDYDVRARISLRYRLFGPGKARADQAMARAFAAEAESEEAYREAEREARTALSDVEQLTSSYLAFADEYAANRTTRNAEVARFRIARGTIFDLLIAEERYFSSATNFLRASSELDAARYILLARSGALLSELRITPQYDWQATE